MSAKYAEQVLLFSILKLSIGKIEAFMSVYACKYSRSKNRTADLLR
jgi:hypothetical protein